MGGVSLELRRLRHVENEQRDAAETRVADANEECVVLRGIVEKNDATIETLEKALREIAIRTGQWEARAIDCQEIAAAALKATP